MSRVKQLTFAARRPDLALRKLRHGAAAIEISPAEVRRHIGGTRTIVEAGALDGRDTVRLSTQWPTAAVHAFEPVPEALENVRRNTASCSNVRLYSTALADKSGSRRMFLSEAADGAFRPDSSSLLRPTGHMSHLPAVHFHAEIEVEALTLDDWAAGEGLEEIDLLWLDLQGMEVAVLAASPLSLSFTRAVMMEVARADLYDSAPLYRETVDWMIERGFSVAIDRVSRLFGNMLFVR